ncbi:hypothetical protein [Phenylobacterium sp.]|uniref:hypothetical protein n=1 Tax=Phenylobacterium sp. TaxID=1871053 RepID=UPI00356A8FDA
MLSAALCLTGMQARADNAAPTFTLNADEAPDPQPWSDPASFSYTKDKGSKAAIAADLAGRLDWALGPTTANTGFARLVAHRNTAAGSQTENYAAEAGLHFEQNTAPRGSTDPDDFKNAYYLFHDLSLAYVYETNFDDEADGCDATPRPAACVRSHQSSLRLKWTLQPYHYGWDTAPSFLDGAPTAASPAVAYAFGPLLTLFADDLVDAKAKNGLKPKGVVSGAAASLNLTLSPKILDYRFVFRASVQQTEAFQRPASRKTGFAGDSTLTKVSLDYDFGLRSFDAGPGWSPSIGISYVKGDDPLHGKLNRQETVFGVKLSYKSK